MSKQIHCPNCGRILGDTDRDLDGIKFNCRGCKKTVDIKLRIASFDSYYKPISKDSSETE